jgi:hypothetical protein
MGYVEYRCLRCGQGTHRVAMSCKSALCLRCAKVHVDDWVSQVSRALHVGVIYRHIILTVPAMFRTPFYQNAAVVLSAFMRCGAQCLDDFYSTVRGKALRGGYITVLHTHGRNGQYHPHLHLIATSGGYDAQGARWEHLQYLPYDLLRPTFKGVWSTVVNFALWPPPDTKPGQYPQHHKRSDDSLGRHGLGSWAYCPQRSARASLA